MLGLCCGKLSVKRYLAIRFQKTDDYLLKVFRQRRVLSGGDTLGEKCDESFHNYFLLLFFTKYILPLLLLPLYTNKTFSF